MPTPNQARGFTRKYPSENRNSRRSFLKNAGAILLGLAGVATAVIASQVDSASQSTATKKLGSLFLANLRRFRIESQEF